MVAHNNPENAAETAVDGAVTLAEYEQAHGLPAGVLRRFQHRKSFPTPVGTRPSRRGKPSNLYRDADLDEFARGLPLPGTTPTEGVTLAEYAAEHGLAVSTLTQTWRKRHAGVWPEPVDRRGRTHLYRRADLDRLARRAQQLPEPEGSPDDLLTWEGVCDYLAPVVTREQMEWRRWAGQWPTGQVGTDGVERWRRAVVEEVQVRIASRRG